MRRRTVLGCAAGVVLWGLSPLAAQVPVKVHRIGYLTMRASLADFDRAFLESLAALGYVDGRNIEIDFRFADSDLERAERMVGELIALKPDVLMVGTAMAVRRKHKRPASPGVCVKRELWRATSPASPSSAPCSPPRSP